MLYTCGHWNCDILCGRVSSNFLGGFITEYRQEQAILRGEPLAVVPTLPLAVAAALILALGLLLLPVPWWISPIVFVVSAFGYGKLLMLGSAKSSTKDDHETRL